MQPPADTGKRRPSTDKRKLPVDKKPPAKKTDWSTLLIPAGILGALALAVMGDDEPPRIPVSPNRRQIGGRRSTNGRGARMAENADDRGAYVPDRPPALSPDTADRIAMLDAVAGAVAAEDRDELRRLTRGRANLARFAREIGRR